uniref:mRNA splicing factor PRP14 n=1 Tax=Lotharella vacuolata TaxID=74820 RepID=A0A0H5BL77_9EUKA|nr:mRNA splicing factor PRP14 [Lotharella vacuolata]
MTIENNTFMNILYIRNLPSDITLIELRTLLEEFGAIYQIRMLIFFYRGFTYKTRGTAFVVFRNSTDANNAKLKLNGKNYRGKYMIVLQINQEYKAKLNNDIGVHFK